MTRGVFEWVSRAELLLRSGSQGLFLRRSLIDISTPIQYRFLEDYTWRVPGNTSLFRCFKCKKILFHTYSTPFNWLEPLRIKSRTKGLLSGEGMSCWSSSDCPLEELESCFLSSRLWAAFRLKFLFQTASEKLTLKINSYKLNTTRFIYFCICSLIINMLFIFSFYIFHCSLRRCFIKIKYSYICCSLWNNYIYSLFLSFSCDCVRPN